MSLLCLRGGENQSKYAFYSLNQSYAKKTESSRIWDTLKTLGLKVGWTVGRVDLSSVDQAQSSATDTLAQGQASLTGLSISLFSRPTYGWQINPSFGFQSIESILKDQIDLPTSRARLAGRLIGTQCSWVGAQWGGRHRQ